MDLIIPSSPAAPSPEPSPAPGPAAIETPPLPASDPAPPAAREASPGEKIPTTDEINESRREELAGLFKNAAERPEPKPPIEDPAPPAPPKDPKAPVPPAAPKPPKAPDAPQPPAADDFDNVKLPPNSSSKASQSFDQVKRMAREKVDTVTKEITTLKTALAEKTTQLQSELENTRKELDETKGYRFAFDAFADPEFQAKHVKPIEEAQQRASNILVMAGANADAIKTVKWNNPAELQSIAESIEEKDPELARMFRDEAFGIRKLNMELGKAVEESRTKHKEIIERKTTEATTRKVQIETTQKKYLETQLSAKDEKGIPKLAWLTSLKPQNPEDPHEVEQVEKHNQAVENYKQNIQFYMTAEKPEDRVNIAISAMASVVAIQRLNAAGARIQQLESELAKVSKAGDPGGENRQTPDNVTKLDPTMSAADHLAQKFPGRFSAQ